MEKKKRLIRFDWFIKKMLRNKSDYRVLEGFLIALLKEEVEIISILESESNKSNEKDKFNRVDILVENSKKEKIIIEIQNEREMGYLKRILFGTSKVIVDHMDAGMKYVEVKKVISISILYFNIGKEKDYIFHGTTEFYGMHTREKLNYSKIEDQDNVFPEYYIICVDKFDDVVKDDLDEWIYMLKNSEVKKEFKSKYIKEARSKLEFEKLSAAEKEIYEYHEKNVYIEGKVVYTARKEGFDKGIKQGRKEGLKEGIKQGEKNKAINIARNMLSQNLSAEMISSITGLSIEEINDLE